MSARPAFVVTWHSIVEGPPPLCTAPRCFEAQLDALANAGYRAISYGELVEPLRSGQVPPAARFALSFDDAYADFAATALPILEERGLPAVLFATADGARQLPGGTGAPLLALEALAGLAGRGVEIGAHSVSHRDLTELDDAALERELAGSREALEAVIGQPVRHFAYPFGRFDARVREAVARHFASAATTELAALPAAVDPLAIPRLDAHYLRGRLGRALLGTPGLAPWLRFRRMLRRVRGSEPRTLGVPVLREATP